MYRSADAGDRMVSVAALAKLAALKRQVEGRRRLEAAEAAQLQVRRWWRCWAHALVAQASCSCTAALMYCSRLHCYIACVGLAACGASKVIGGGETLENLRPTCLWY